MFLFYDSIKFLQLKLRPSSLIPNGNRIFCPQRPCTALYVVYKPSAEKNSPHSNFPLMHETSDYFYPPFQCSLPPVQAFLPKKISYASWLELHCPLLLSGTQKQGNCFCYSMSLTPLSKVELRPEVALQSSFYSELSFFWFLQLLHGLHRSCVKQAQKYFNSLCLTPSLVEQ